MENTKKNIIRENIVSHRNARGWTQADLAEHIGMKSNTYATKESKGNFKTSELLVIAEALNIDIKDFFIFEEAIENTTLPQKINEQPTEIKVEPDLLPTAKERAVIQIMRASKQNKDIFLTLMNTLYNKNISDDKLQKILDLLNED